MYDQSLIIITSDHGEEFKEHGSFLHWQPYYRPNLHVPLIMHIPNYPKKEIRIARIARSIDILPTVLDLAKLPAHPNAQGESLLSLIKQRKSNIYQFLWKIIHPFSKDTKISFAENEIFFRPYFRSAITYDGYQLISNQEFSQTPKII